MAWHRRPRTAYNGVIRPKLPLIAVTMGDPAGVGPEIIVGAWAEPAVHEWCRPLVVGHPEILRRAVELCGRRT